MVVTTETVSEWFRQIEKTVAADPPQGDVV